MIVTTYENKITNMSYNVYTSKYYNHDILYTYNINYIIYIFIYIVLNVSWLYNLLILIIILEIIVMLRNISRMTKWQLVLTIIQVTYV